jgi:hypothetical protein
VRKDEQTKKSDQNREAKITRPIAVSALTAVCLVEGGPLLLKLLQIQFGSLDHRPNDRVQFGFQLFSSLLHSVLGIFFPTKGSNGQRSDGRVWGERLDSLDDLLIPTNFLTANFFDCHRFLRNLSPSKYEARLSRESREVQTERQTQRQGDYLFILRISVKEFKVG